MHQLGVTSFQTCWVAANAQRVKFLKGLMEKPKRDFTVIVGGAKVSTKIQMLDNFIHKANNIIIGGGMAFTFMKAMVKI